MGFNLENLCGMQAIKPAFKTQIMQKIDTSRYLTSVVKSELQTTYNYRLKVKHRLSKAFAIIPNEAIINKGRCGIGGTFLETRAERNSIIIVPTTAIIDNKCFVKGVLKPNYYDVRGKFTPKDFAKLKTFVESDIQNKKIFSTPEGLGKLLRCKADVDDIKNNWFLLFDESHTSITESYRKGILDAFKYFFLFRHKALISATPYLFSHDGFKTFDIYNIRFRGNVGRVTIENTNNVSSLLNGKLINPKAFSGRVHIFLNSVAEIAKAIRMASLEDYSVFCREDKKNIEKLDELRSHLKDFPNESNYAKFNFYTSKYFEGWDLHDFNATIIIVSDVESMTLMNGVSNKCVQAAGRNRYYSNQTIHITNSRNIQQFNPLGEIQKLTLSTAKRAAKDYNEHLQEVFIGKDTYDKNYLNLVNPYADINQPDGTAYVNDFKVDQLVNCTYTSQEYNHVKYIIEAWQNAGYAVRAKDLFVFNLPANILRLSHTNRIKVTVGCLEQFECDNLVNKISIDDLRKYIATLPIDTRKICNDYLEIGGAKMRELCYNPKMIDEKVLESKNVINRIKIKEEYYRTMGTTAQVKSTIADFLQVLYRKYNYVNPKSGKVKTAAAVDIKGFYTHVKNERKGTVNGLRIVKY